MAMKQAGCTKVAVANDKEAYGSGLATLLELEKGMYGVTIVSNTGIDPTAAELPQLRLDDRLAGRELLLLRRHRVQRRGPDHQGRQRRAARPPRSSAATACAPSSFTAGVAGRRARVDRQADRVHGRHPEPRRLPGRQAVPRRYKAAYGVSDPDPYAIYGYEAMKLGLRHDRVARRERRQQGRRAQGAVRHQEHRRRCSAPSGSTRTATRRSSPTASTRSASTACRSSSRR